MDFVPDASHDWIDVDDVCSGLVTLANNEARGIYELGTGTSYFNGEVRAIVEKITGKKANVRIVQQLRTYDTSDWRCRDFSVMKYGWKPTKTIEQSIREMVEAYGS